MHDNSVIHEVSYTGMHAKVHAQCHTYLWALMTITYDNVLKNNFLGSSYDFEKFNFVLFSSVYKTDAIEVCFNATTASTTRLIYLGGP